MKISYHAIFNVTNHLMQRMEERVKSFKNKRKCADFCRKALVNREPSYTIYEGTKVSKVISDDLVFIVDITDPWKITVITVYYYDEYLHAG